MQGEMFLQKVERVQAELIQPTHSVSPMTCTPPAPHAYEPEAAMVSFLDFTGRSGTVELLWTIKMKNGDTILLRQKHVIEPIETLNYHPEDYAMGTIDELQALIDELEWRTDGRDTVNIYLPPVTYVGDLDIEDRAINLYGSAGGEGRTTFTGTVRVTTQNSGLSYFRDIDFVGNAGVGISATARLHVIDCSFTGWKTAVLAYGNAWVNIAGSQFEHNGIGFHFNSAGDSVTHTLYTGNRFLGNETAVLLESVPSDVTMSFDECLFSENGKDIDNPCGQSINISEATFQ